MNRQPLLIALVFFIFGILLSEFYTFSWWFLGGVFGSLFLFFFCNLRYSNKVKVLCYCVAFFVMGAVLHTFHSTHKMAKLPKEKGHFVFLIDNKLNNNERNRKYEITIVQNRDTRNVINEKVILSVPKSYSKLDFKHYYAAHLNISNVEAPKEDFQFNYARYLRRKGIASTAWLYGKIESSEKKMSLAETIKQFRWDCLENISNSTLHSDTKEFTKGIILADRTEMNSQMVDDFSKTGLVHFLAISGTHMVIIFWLILFLLKKILPVRFRKYGIVISLVCIWIFTIIIDYGSSVVRSSVMITIYYGYYLLKRKPDLLHAMALAGFVLLLFNTNALFDVGFQLSFVAVLGIFWLNPAFISLFPKPKNPIAKFSISLLCVSISAQMATLPLVIYYFHQYSVLSLVANIVIVPFSEIIIVFSLLMTIILAGNLQIDWLNTLFDEVIHILLQCIHFFSTFNWAMLENIPLFLVELLLLYLALYLLRDVLLKKNVQQFLRFSFILLVFFSIRLGYNWVYLLKEEKIEMKNRNKKVVLYKRKHSVICYADEKMPPEDLKKYILNPYLSSRRISEYKIIYFK